MLAELQSKSLTLTVKSGQALASATQEAVAETPAPAAEPTAETPAADAPVADAPAAKAVVPTEPIPAKPAATEAEILCEPEGAEFATSADEERLCKMAMC